ncbi:uncharacterized protein LOC112590168 [Harpegnathos saltator]|uniref:uncharacterized protein LOC112590168 n=1 Tax=Harpegnathos saltator TaxID=610380 RepID=UPI000DBEF23C|nr:uncharacterized protein LOC112590168 [Harpegnathos saltator]
MAQFVKNLAIAVFGINTLKNSSVTGAKSNRNKNKKQETPRPALDSTKLQAIRATVKHYAMSEKGEDEVTADYEAQQIGTHIAHKIYELNNPPNRKGRRKQSPILMHEQELVSYPLLQHFNPKAETELHTDACSQGLGAILLQKQSFGHWAPVAYYSQTTN